MPQKAEKAYEEALRLQPQFVPAYINYSNFLMQKGKNNEAFEVLEKGISILPKMGILHHALGLWYVRNKVSEKALDELKMALDLSPENARFAYVYAIALAEKEPQKAIEVLEEAYQKHSGDPQIVSALGYYYKQSGNVEKAKIYEEKLEALQNFSVH